MSKVLIKSIDLHYFKGTKSQKVEFKEEQTTISGPNGSGKSTIADAFTWCLFGKNMKGESDTKFLVKTVDDAGNEIPHVEHSVEMVLDVDGTEQKLRRNLVPEYDKDDNLCGNHTEYYWNEVPMKKSEYDQKVKDIIDETVLKMVTSPFAFLTLDWKKQREMLMNMAGEIDEIEIAARSEEFTELLSKITGKSLDEYRREIACKLQRINEEMTAIPVRIDELKRNIPDCASDKDMARKAEVEAELEKIAAEEKSILDSMSASNDRCIAKAKELNDIKQKQFQILNEAEAKERAAIHEQNLKYDEADAKMRNLENAEKVDANECSELSKSLQKSLTTHSLAMVENDGKLANLRNEWMMVNAEQFALDDNLKCPLFGHGCTDDHACSEYAVGRNKTHESWIDSKKKRLAAISEQGKVIKVENESKKEFIDGITKQIEDIKVQYDERCAKRIKEAAELDTIRKQNPRKPLIASVKGEDIPEWVELGLDIAKLEQELNDMKSASTSTISKERLEEKDALKAELESLNRLAANASVVDQTNKRIFELESQLTTLGGNKSVLENQKRIADEFEIAKMDEVGNRVNALFDIVEWKMFQRQVNGENVPACIALVNGVRWDCANTASMINAGIDVAYSLSKAYKVSAPVFIDNAESVGCIYNPGMQQILLKFDIISNRLVVG